MFDALKKAGFQIEFHSHAEAILAGDFPSVESELEEVLASATIPIEEIIAGGGGEAKGTQRLRRGLQAKGWETKTFVVEKRINDVPREAISHKMDHVKAYELPNGSTATIAMESSGTTRIHSTIATWRILSGSMPMERSRSGSSSPEGATSMTICETLLGGSSTSAKSKGSATS